MGEWTPADYALAARDWSKQPAGDAMDRAVEQLNIEGGPLGLRPSRDPLAALTLLDCLSAVGTTPTDSLICEVVITRSELARGVANRWSCDLAGHDWDAEGYGDTLALAICRALLHYQQDEERL